MAASDDAFPCKLTIRIPLPTARLASAAMRSLAVDKELSPLVRRSFTLEAAEGQTEATVLRTDYSATTDRMLRVSTNGFFESIGVALQVMQELDVDVMHDEGTEDLEKVQGVEYGMEGSTLVGG